VLGQAPESQPVAEWRLLGARTTPGRIRHQNFSRRPAKVSVVQEDTGRRLTDFYRMRLDARRQEQEAQLKTYLFA